MKNKMINNNKMIVVWHMDGLKVSHINSFEINKFAGYLSSMYVGLTVHRRNVHDYLVMTRYSEVIHYKIPV